MTQIDTSYSGYAYQKYRSAVKCLASVDVTLQERLFVAVHAAALSHLRENNVPRDLRFRHNTLMADADHALESNDIEEMSRVADEIRAIYDELRPRQDYL